MPPYNFFQDMPTDLSHEYIQKIICAPGIRIERIVSSGQTSPPGFWYDQDEHEWVMLLQGASRLRFETKPETMLFAPGDSLNIPAHVRHRVDWTDPDQATVWLAVFYERDSNQTEGDL